MTQETRLVLVTKIVQSCSRQCDDVLAWIQRTAADHHLPEVIRFQAYEDVRIIQSNLESVLTHLLNCREGR